MKEYAIYKENNELSFPTKILDKDLPLVFKGSWAACWCYLIEND